MDEIKKFKEKAINDFFYNNIDLTNVNDDLKASELKEGLKRVLGEEPAIKFCYKQERKLNEDSGEMERMPKELESIEIYYTYLDSENKPHASHMKYIVN
jgi:hypothetical protein